MYDDFINNFGYIVDPLDSVTDSLIIRTTTSDGLYYVDEAASSVFITPSLMPNNLIMPSPEITRDNNIINRKTSWVINFKINANAVPKDGFITISVP